MSKIRTVGVCGAGLMGNGIAQTAASAGFDVILMEVAEAPLQRGLASIAKSLDKFVEKGKLPQSERDAIVGRIKGTTSIADLKNCDLVIEAIVENPEAKKSLFKQLDELLAPHAIICTNTSSFCVIELAATTKRPNRVAGLHFFNPVPIMKLVEVVRTIATTQDTIDELYAFAKTLGKEPILAQDTPGFVVNRLLIPYLLYAIRCYEGGLASKEDIDKGMKLGCGYPMGPLELLDFVGLDTTYYIAQIMFEEFKDPMMAAPPLLKRMVLAGRHGRKSGKGFYDYE
ncbi:MAG: 3-hydroxybutyryl-CoA dehydrogenase [Candidatus Eremiobacteraeota bacterium]|uniref:3-hydroxybutyryl-CoA dehydrogenase (Beta-hydroxybutyryl-CoA dehydrogenase) (BHBD) n=1 Tax=mine drainage metagenome TaxID=410659 RepID=E6PCF4_9ZZZZ|nr:3-hydroxybutyryl-CoA dehydrogenase [Candidatus Eremiobacteraeota bacterium]